MVLIYSFMNSVDIIWYYYYESLIRGDGGLGKVSLRPPPIVRERVVSPEAQTRTNGALITLLAQTLKDVNVG